MMAGLVRYLTHPQVQVDPSLDVVRWSLDPVGSARVRGLADRPSALAGTTRVVCSAETKAVETAAPLAAALGLVPEVRPAMHENDRSATGYLPPDEFERVADAFFAEPEESIRGWETASQAQRRVVGEVEAVLSHTDAGDVLIVGHGGVGTLLFCALSGVAIDRRHDQPPGSGGCWFAFERTIRKPLGTWQRMEALSGDPG